MSSNWAEEFRRRIEEREGKYRPAHSYGGMDDEEWEEKEEEDAELEEPENEAEEEAEEVEQEEEDEEVEQKAEKPEIEKPLPTAVETPKPSLERQKFRQELDKTPGSTTIQPAKTEVTKVKPAKRETNDLAVAGAAMVGLMVLSLMPTFYQAMMQAFQPLIQSFQSSRSYSTSAGSQQWVACPYCGYQCLGYDGMPCPRCGRG